MKTDENERSANKTYCTFSQAIFERNVINHILESLAPLNTVEMPAFRKIFDDMNIKKNGVSLKHLSARTVGRSIKKVFEENTSKIMGKVATVKYVCTTADVWSSRTRRFLGMTVHWIDEITFERQSFAIACRRFEGNHSYDRVAQFIRDIHMSYGINNSQIVATITDNGSNFVKAFREFGVEFGDSFFHDGIVDTLNDEESEFGGDHGEIQSIEKLNPDDLVLPQHFRCASHTLSLVATKDAIPAIKASPRLKLAYDEMIEKCNTLWRLSASPKQSEKLQKHLGQSLRRPIVTRWNSLYDAVQQILNLKEKLIQIPNESGIRNLFRPTDFRFMEEYIRCNQPIASAFDVLQGENICSYGYLLPTLISVRNKLKNYSGHLEWCEILVHTLLKGLEDRFRTFFDVTGEGRVSAVAAASHPSFKLRWLHCLSPSAQDNVFAALKDSLATIINNQVDNEEQSMDVVDDYDFFDFTEETSNTIVFNDRTFGINDGEAAFQRFFNETRTDMQLLNLHPIVKQIFFKFNTPLPSSAPVERLFSYATMFNLPKFNRLTDENFELRVLMKANASI
ncbi:uncharacterized protein [Venturia canescens]|uniref:uncharacterized protein n=1 Tax=Venturia canescens TaxID=32260 RepID=UPI001C9CFAC8|nr:uncharacterized protein LOC122413340 [Venturia canescens]